MNLDKAFDIYEEFLLHARKHDHFESARSDEEGNEKLLLRFTCGFTVELTNKKYVENSAALRCWWQKEESRTEIDTIDKLFQEFEKFKNSN